MDAIVIKGGRALNGEVRISGAKNAALPMLAATLLVGGKFHFSNVPDLKDIESILQLLATIGAEVDRQGEEVTVDTRGVDNFEAPYELVRRMRASVLVLGPLLARLKRARVSLPGGCAIGARPINMHLEGLERLGAEITLEHGYVEAAAETLTGEEIFFDVPTVTGTENLMMAAVFAKGTTVLRNAAREPEVTALADMLNRMGAQISGAGTPNITISGVETLAPVAAEIIPDRIEAGTYMVAAALTQGNIRITRAEPDHLKPVIAKLRESGAGVELSPDAITVTGSRPVCSVDIKTLPFPGFPTDMQAQFMVLMSIANGLSVITETIFENRFIHVLELQRMGADIQISGNHAMIKGAEKLSGAPVMASDLRASASLVLAGLVAEGTTRISRVYHLDRGYEAIEQKFGQLGANIKRISETTSS
ncbi:MAG: UDP-N-acetylglucosamine 1-carboxyvinyltransferase [Desulfobacterales bacterium]